MAASPVPSMDSGGEGEREALRPVARPEPARHRRHRLGRPLLLGVLVLAVAALVLWGGDWVRSRLLWVHEVDARVVAEMVAVGARTDGWLLSVDVAEGDAVAAGAPLARLDARAARLRLDELRAETEALRAERAQLAARRAMLDEQTASGLSSAASGLEAARALSESLEHELELATAEYERARELARGGVVSANDLDRSRTAYLRARQELLRSRAEIAAQEANLAAARAERRRLAVLDGEAAVLAKRLVQQEAKVAGQALAVEEHEVVAPRDGVVSRLFVEAGEYLRRGQRLALLHDPGDVWVEANIRETQIGRVRVGQPVRVVVDAYPDLELSGRVERIGQATTGEFALLPTPNPSGNFTKVTQRLPVRIAVPQHEGPLRPGMLVEVYIDVEGAAGDAS